MVELGQRLRLEAAIARDLQAPRAVASRHCRARKTVANAPLPKAAADRNRRPADRPRSRAAATADIHRVVCSGGRARNSRRNSAARPGKAGAVLVQADRLARRMADVKLLVDHVAGTSASTGQLGKLGHVLFDRLGPGGSFQRYSRSTFTASTSVNRRSGGGPAGKKSARSGGSRRFPGGNQGVERSDSCCQTSVTLESTSFTSLINCAVLASPLSIFLRPPNRPTVYRRVGDRCSRRSNKKSRPPPAFEWPMDTTVRSIGRSGA